MIDLKVAAKDMDILTSSFSNEKIVNKSSNKDFLEILENQKINQDKPKVVNIDKEKLNKKVEVQEKTVNFKTLEKKGIEEENKVEEETGEEKIDEELITLFQTLYDLILKLEEKPLEVEELNLETLNLEVEKLSDTLGQILEEDNLSFTHEDIIGIAETLETLISSLEKELDKFKNILKENPIDLSMEETLLELDTIKIKIEEIKDNPQLMEENNINFENEDEDKVITLNNVSSEEMEFDEILDMEKEVSRIDEPIVENLVEEGEDVKTENANSNNLLFETTDMLPIKGNFEIMDKVHIEVDEKQIIEQIVNKAKLIVDDNKQELRIKLKPEILGELMLKMEVVKGSVLAKVMVDNYRTKELIEANLYQLKEDMKENGLEIKTFEVFVGSNQDFDKEDTEQFNFKKRPNKIKIKDDELKEIKIYDENITRNIEGTYEEGQLNLFA